MCLVYVHLSAGAGPGCSRAEVAGGWLWAVYVGREPNVGPLEEQQGLLQSHLSRPIFKIVEFGKRSDMIYIRYDWYKRTSFVSERQIV